MGIRHVSGIKEWGGYQRAKLVSQMRDDLKLEPSEVAERPAMTTHEVNRRYRAFKALQQMQSDDDFSGFAKPGLYPLFHEAVSILAVREWLGWNDEDNRFPNEDTLRTFYELITPPDGDDQEDQKPPKMTGYSQVRQLRSVLPKPEAMKVLLDPNRSFQDASTLAKSEEFNWALGRGGCRGNSVARTMTIHEVKNLSKDDFDLLQKLVRVVNERIEDHKSLAQASTQAAKNGA